MAKVKLFRFRVSSASSFILEGDNREQWYRNGLEELVTEEEIETTINEFLSNKELLSLNVSKVDVCTHRHNRGNVIDLIYTITYK